jgi:hypothetical protein
MDDSRQEPWIIMGISLFPRPDFIAENKLRSSIAHWYEIEEEMQKKEREKNSYYCPMFGVFSLRTLADIKPGMIVLDLDMNSEVEERPEIPISKAYRFVSSLSIVYLSLFSFLSISLCQRTCFFSSKLFNHELCCRSSRNDRISTARPKTRFEECRISALGATDAAVAWVISGRSNGGGNAYCC